MKDGWAKELLGTICEILDNRRKPITKKDRVPGPYPYYGATGVLDHVTGFLFDEPLVLVGEDGAKWGAGDKSAFPISGKTWVNNHAHVLRPDRATVLDEWLIYYLNQTDLGSFISGLTVPKLNQAKLREIPIPVPPLPEQHRIVAILDEAFAGIDQAVKNTEQNLASARELFESELNRVFSEDDLSYPHEPLADVCDKITVGHVGPMAKSYKAGGVPFLRSQNIRPFRLDLDSVVYIDAAFHKRLSKSRLFPGDVAVVRTGYPGTACVIPKELPESNCSDLVIMRPGERIDADYLAMFLNSQFGKRLVADNLTGSAQKHFNITAAKKVRIGLPTISEQRQRVKLANTLRSESDRLVCNHQQKLAALAELKQSLLQKAFAGELTKAEALESVY